MPGFDLNKAAVKETEDTAGHLTSDVKPMFEKEAFSFLLY